MNQAWAVSTPLLSATGMELQQCGPDPLCRILFIIYCVLGSLAALKYLLQSGRRPVFLAPSPKTSGKLRDAIRLPLRRKPRARRPKPTPPAPPAPCQPAPDRTPEPPAAPPVTAAPPPAPAVTGQPPEPASDLPAYPSRSEILGIYEVENPGYSRNTDYGLRLKRVPDGVLLSCGLDQELVCVFLLKGLTDVGSNLQRLGLQEVFDLTDAAGQPLDAYPPGRLRLLNVVPAICKDLGTSLQLVEKGQVKVFVKD